MGMDGGWISRSFVLDGKKRIVDGRLHKEEDGTLKFSVANSDLKKEVGKVVIKTDSEFSERLSTNLDKVWELLGQIHDLQTSIAKDLVRMDDRLGNSRRYDVNLPGVAGKGLLNDITKI